MNDWDNVNDDIGPKVKEVPASPLAIFLPVPTKVTSKTGLPGVLAEKANADHQHEIDATDIKLKNIKTSGLTLNNRSAYAEVYRNAVYSNPIIAMPLGVRVIICTIVFSANAGDLVNATGTVQIIPGGLSGIGFVCMFMNGSQVTIDTAVQEPAGGRISIPLNELCGYSVPANGSYTLTIQGYTYSSAPLYQALDAQINVHVMANR